MKFAESGQATSTSFLRNALGDCIIEQIGLILYEPSSSAFFLCQREKKKKRVENVGVNEVALED